MARSRSGGFWARITAGLPLAPKPAVTVSPPVLPPPPYGDFAQALLPFADPRSGESTVLRGGAKASGGAAPASTQQQQEIQEPVATAADDDTGTVLRVGGLAVSVHDTSPSLAEPWVSPWDTPEAAAEAARRPGTTSSSSGTASASQRPLPGAEPGLFVAHTPSAREAAGGSGEPARVVGPGSGRGGRGEGGEGVSPPQATGRPGGTTLSPSVPRSRRPQQ